jgi:hypothetical protein
MTGRIVSVMPLLLCPVLVGCGSADWGSAGGTVTLDGEPLQAGDITFQSVGKGPTATGKVIDGSFTVSTGQKAGVEVGKYAVTVSNTVVAKAGNTERAKLLTPPRYAAKATSGLQADVKAGANQFEFKMLSKP